LRVSIFWTIRGIGTGFSSGLEPTTTPSEIGVSSEWQKSTGRNVNSRNNLIKQCNKWKHKTGIKGF
jgi:hypothetical protein